MYTTIEPLGYTYIANRMLYVNCTSIKKNLFIEKNSWVLANSRQNSWFSIGKEAVSRCFIQEKKKRQSNGLFIQTWVRVYLYTY